MRATSACVSVLDALARFSSDYMRAQQTDEHHVSTRCFCIRTATATATATATCLQRKEEDARAGRKLLSIQRQKGNQIVPEDAFCLVPAADSVLFSGHITERRPCAARSRPCNPCIPCKFGGGGVGNGCGNRMCQVSGTQASCFNTMMPHTGGGGKGAKERASAWLLDA
jgi:hypothetical protein